MMFLYIVQIQTVSFHLGLKIIWSRPKSTGLSSFSQVKVPFCRYTHLPPKKYRLYYLPFHIPVVCIHIPHRQLHVPSPRALRRHLRSRFFRCGGGVAAPSETERHVFSHTPPFYGWKLIYWSTPLGFTQTPLASNGRTCWISRPCPVACNAWCRCPWRFCPWQWSTLGLVWTSQHLRLDCLIQKWALLDSQM